MKRLILGLLLIYSVNVLEAYPSEQITSGEIGNTSNEILIGYNPADFNIVGTALPGAALINVVITDLYNSRCSNDIKYTIVGSEDSRIMQVIKKESELSSSTYANPRTQLTPNILIATHLVKGNAIFKQGNVSINLSLEDRQECLWYQAKVSGSENDFNELVDKAIRLLGKKICMSEPKVQNCQALYYTIVTSKKTTTKLKPIENYRGINKTLKSFEEDKDTYYIYVDTDKATIEQLHIDSKSTRTIHREHYELNMASCKYEPKSEDKVVKNLGGSSVLKSEDVGWGFEDDTKFYIDLPSSQKELSFTWGRLKSDGSYSKHLTYRKKIPQIVKNMMKKVNDMATLFRNETKNSKEIETFKALYDYPGTPRDVQCVGKVAMESLLIPRLDGLQDPDVEFKINIRASTKEEKKVMKAYRKRRF